MLSRARLACMIRQIPVHSRLGHFKISFRPLPPANYLLERQYATTNAKRPLQSAKNPRNSNSVPSSKHSNEKPLSPKLPPNTTSYAGAKGNTPVAPTGDGSQYPTQLLIYHAGTGRTIFISVFKLTAMFVFIWSAVLIAPSYYFSPLEPNYKAATAVALGAVPLFVMVFTTAPFVTYIHLALPLWARASQGRLMRYAESLPSSAVLDITSLRWIWPRVTRLHASELYIHKNQVGAMTLRRSIPDTVLQARRWWHWRPLRQFYVAGKSAKTTEKGVWELVVGSIAKNKGPTTNSRKRS